MSLSTRRSAGGLPSSVRIPRSSSSVRDQEARPRTRDNSHPPSSSDNRFRSQRSRSVPREESDDPYRSGRAYDTPPVPSIASRHSVQSSVSSSSSGASSAVSAASTAPSSLWDYAGWKGTSTGSAHGSEEQVLAGSHTDNSNTLWSRVTAAAGGLSINVGKAWEAKDDLPEPDTPPGRDSRVTVALKKHYINQVSDPRQLPAWLFSDIERQVGRSTRRADLPPDASTDGPPHAAPAPSRLRARHDDAYSQPQIAPTRERTQTVTHDEEYKGPTRAATRLRAMRDARRGPVVDREVHVPAVAVPEPEPEPVVVAVPPRPRVGLPSRPTRPRRE
ncbi:hypothetical protein FS749_011283 [Ceratobasidium sp. UAMH 11750]|nr:hypothetical protein FS749_011283 [Ceratobasidium sp. UAMH 11750]